MNRYSQEFNSEMTSEEARLKLFTLAKKIKKDNLEELYDAYESVAQDILERELKDANENGTLD